MPHYVFLTGHMAEENLCTQLQRMDPSTFTWAVVNVGVKVAALMTTELLLKRLPALLNNTRSPDKIYLPGLFGGVVDSLSTQFGIPFEHGPRDLRDLPEFFGAKANPQDLNKHNCLIFAEIVDAPGLSPEQILQRGFYYQSCGADVIDVGCLPDRKFPHLKESIDLLKAEGLKVSVDSANENEILTGAKAGADYLLSLSETTLWINEESDAIPIVVPENPSEPESLYRCIDKLSKDGGAFYADPILDPLLMGFTNSLLRYKTVRQRYPDCQIFMGIGNVSELVEADSGGINSMLMGIVAELNIQAVLTTEVSDHTRRAVLETDLARRIMHRAKLDNSLPKRYHKDLLSLHEIKPFPYSTDEIEAQSSAIRERNYRIQVSDKGIHLYNNEYYGVAHDPFTLMNEIDISDDWTHAFYLGVELSRAQVAWQLGKRYTQDHELSWGVGHRLATSRWQETGKSNEKDKNDAIPFNTKSNN